MAWRDVSEQEAIAARLRAALRLGRVVHAYLFAGPRGVGKKKMARELSKALVCARGGDEACDACRDCRRVEEGNHPDVRWIAPEGASLRIEQIRELKREAAYRTLEARQKVVVLERADTLTAQAANSLLKFLEEPPVPTVVVLLTENAHSLLPTIRSRCQLITFPPLDAEWVAARLTREGVPAGQARLAAHLAPGLDAARQICQSEWFAPLKTLVIQWTQDLVQQGAQSLLTLQDKLFARNPERDEVLLWCDLLLLWYRDVLHVQLGRRERLAFAECRNELERQAAQWSQAGVLQALDAVLAARKRLALPTNAQLVVEQLAIRLLEGIRCA